MDVEGGGTQAHTHRIAAALNALTYVQMPNITAAELRQQLPVFLAKATEDAHGFLADKDLAMQTWGGALEADRFGRKRLWAALRDYLKSSEFNDCFLDALAEAGGDGDRWRIGSSTSNDALFALELPGDVWNERMLTFIANYLRGVRKSWGISRIVREMHGQLPSAIRSVIYPEQLDVTFDFIPRMCERDMCRLCPFGRGIDAICHGQVGLYCSVAAVSCGYLHRCAPEQCPVVPSAAAGLCAASSA